MTKETSVFSCNRIFFSRSKRLSSCFWSFVPNWFCVNSGPSTRPTVDVSLKGELEEKQRCRSKGVRPDTQKGVSENDKRGSGLLVLVWGRR